MVRASEGGVGLNVLHHFLCISLDEQWNIHSNYVKNSLHKTEL